MNSQYAIEVEDLRKNYEGFSIQDVSFRLPSGYITGLIGRNGAGKTTLIDLILGTRSRDGGSVKIFGSIVDGKLGEMADSIGVVFDEANLPSELTIEQIGNVLENIYPNWDEARFRQLIGSFELSGKKPIRSFSKGMKTKAAIACALAHHPKLLILDEPTSGLDPVIREEILEIFYDFTREEDHSILISSHIVSDLERLCDYILFIQDGKIVLDEDKDTLLDRYGRLILSREKEKDVPPEAIVGRKETPYQVELLVERDKLSNWSLEPASIEDIFLFSERRAS